MQLSSLGTKSTPLPNLATIKKLHARPHGQSGVIPLIWSVNPLCARLAGEVLCFGYLEGDVIGWECGESLWDKQGGREAGRLERGREVRSLSFSWGDGFVDGGMW